MTTQTPAIFVGHGSPMNVLSADNPVNQGFRRIVRTFPKPRAILMISAHWYHHTLAVTAGDFPELIYDFYGFPEALYQVQYPAHGDAALAERVKELLGDGVVLDKTRGFDHGTWAVLKHLYPDADVPVVQLSLDRSKPALWHWQTAQKLAALRDEGVLIMGSGDIVHNLRMMEIGKTDGYDWAYEFQSKINEAIVHNNPDGLIRIEDFGDISRYAVPTDEHYLPLLYVMAVRSDDEPVEIFNDYIEYGSVSMTSVKVG